MRRISLLILAVLAAGCTPYVNIPPHGGDMAFHSPNKQTVREIEAVAGRAAVENRPIEGTFQVVLPEGSSVLTYEAVVPRISENAIYTTDGSVGELPVLAIKQIRIRASVGEVDIVRPVAQDRSEFITVYLGYDPMAKWGVDRIRVWRTFDPRREDPIAGSIAPVVP
jgi:hypothetical protein